MTSYDEVQGLLRGLLVQIPVPPTDDLDLIEQFISNNEYGLAVEVLMDTIEERGLPLSESQLTAIAEAGRMAHVGPEYARWLIRRDDASGPWG